MHHLTIPSPHLLLAIFTISLALQCTTAARAQPVRAPDAVNATLHADAVQAQNEGRHAEAVLLFEAEYAALVHKHGERHAKPLQVAMQLSRSHQALGQLDKLLAIDERNLWVARALFGPSHRDTLAAMANLAQTYSDLGQLPRADRLCKQVLALAEQHLGPDDAVTVRTYVILANIKAGLGLADESVRLDRHTLDVRRRTLPPGHADIESSLNNLSASLAELGQLEESLAMAEEAYRLRLSRLGEAHHSTLISATGLAESYTLKGRYDEAERLARQTLKWRLASFGPGHADTLITHYALVEALWGLGRQDDALAEARAAAAAIEQRRQSAGPGSEDRQGLLSAYAVDLQNYARWHGEAGAEHWAQGFEIAERAKARTLLETMSQVSSLRLAELAPADRDRVAALQQQVARLGTQVAQAARGGPARQAEAAHALLQRQAAEVELLGVRESLARQHPRLGTATGQSTATAADAPTLLRAGEVYVSWLLDRTGRLQAWTLRPDGGLRYTGLGEHKNLAEQVKAFNTALRSRRPGAVASAVDLGQALARTLLAPIADELGAAPRWLLAPDGPLAMLPIEALPMPGATGPVVAHHTVSRVQSLAVLRELRHREIDYAQRDDRRTLLAMGNAAYDRNPAHASQRGQTRGWQPGTARGADANRQSSRPDAAESDISLADLRWSNIPGTLREVNDVAKALRRPPGMSLGDSDDIVVLTGRQASESRLRALNAAGALARYRYLLFAAHGHMASEPALSSVVLSQTRKTAQDDGYVTAVEWPAYALRSDLTVISGCDSGIGQALPGEGVLGLPYALFAAGNLNTLLTLWPIDDQATAEFVSRFFGRIAAGDAPARALAETQRGFAAHPRWSAPRYWAAFVLYGP
jgi:tetratricopeptide (TPR) repeat protein